jgi:acetyltransferase-like isoleucine patch superfamily enzyme
MGVFSFSNSSLHGHMRIGRYCSIATRVEVLGERHPMEWATTSAFAYTDDPPLHISPAIKALQEMEPEFRMRTYQQPDPTVTVGHDVWIGQEVSISRGVTIGSGAVVGARALVTKDVPPYAVVVGQPARVVKYRFNEDLIERFLRLEWWRFRPELLRKGPIDEPDRFLDFVDERVGGGDWKPMSPSTLTFSEMVAASASTSQSA